MGTGIKAVVAGYRVGGKTGTAQKPTPAGGYSKDKHLASFVGFAPARSPRLVCLVMIDEPKGSTHGGEVAAPAFAAIVSQSLLYLGVAPDRDLWTASDGWMRSGAAGRDRLDRWARSEPEHENPRGPALRAEPRLNSALGAGS